MEGCWWYVSGCVDIGVGVGVGGEVEWEKKVNQGWLVVTADMGEQSHSK